ncbi:DUF3105 domain-containing protein [Streptomyces sp. CC228A]|uniref:DUF3105 domain-containing protein n=1 Tax=Streptomyces sp. CC228A TaxID=2898186 RepID=UPI001F3D643D|nr:DUF3105 domain-containing protein [Streptomyces sp. CC228A]
MYRESEHARRTDRHPSARGVDKPPRLRNGRKWILLAAVALIAAAAGGWYALDTRGDVEGATSALVRGEQTWSGLSRKHVTTEVTYPMSPPAGGDHHPRWTPCDSKIYSSPVADENAVHSLEHGAVWITHGKSITAPDLHMLTEMVSSTPYAFLSPYTPQSTPIVLTAWGHQLKVNEASDPRVKEFLEKYVQGEQTPEKGAPCTSGEM